MSMILCASGRGEKHGGMMKNITKRLWAALFCAAVLITGACGKGANENSANPTPTSAGAAQSPEEPTPATMTTPPAEPEAKATPTGEGNEPSGSAAEGAPYYVTLPDGMVLELAGTPQRIVSMGPNITDMLFALGAGDRVVGRTDYCDTPAGVENIPSVGTLFTPDVEKILSLAPDLVIGSLLFSEETQKQLSDLGIQVAVLYDSKSIEGIYDMIRALGALTGQSEEGEALAERTKKQIEDAAAKYTGGEYADFKAPTVYYVSGYGEYGDYTAGGDTYIGQLLAAAGGENIAQDVEGWVISREVLIEADPQIIIIGDGMAADFCATPGYEELSAVKNNRVFEFDLYHLLERQSHRNAEIFVQLAELFHTPLTP
ncbi:MAG: ABC transporter substrate-binding protein [Lachnospiraceae bacterium]|nr:ABC transporter substrate-binding protein [Lachnospiraceae bacterium]